MSPPVKKLLSRLSVARVRIIPRRISSRSARVSDAMIAARRTKPSQSSIRARLACCSRAAAVTRGVVSPRPDGTGCAVARRSSSCRTLPRNASKAASSRGSSRQRRGRTRRSPVRARRDDARRRTRRNGAPVRSVSPARWVSPSLFVNSTVPVDAQAHAGPERSEVTRIERHHGKRPPVHRLRDDRGKSKKRVRPVVTIAAGAVCARTASRRTAVVVEDPLLNGTARIRPAARTPTSGWWRSMIVPLWKSKPPQNDNGSLVTSASPSAVPSTIGRPTITRPTAPRPGRPGLRPRTRRNQPGCRR